MASNKVDGAQHMGWRRAAGKNDIRYCQLCGCNVPGAEQSWQTHMAGIRHRRNAVSCRVFGEPGHAVVSVFEQAALQAPGQHPSSRYQDKDLVLKLEANKSSTPAHASKGRSATASTHTSSPATEPLQQCCRRLQQQICAQLAHQVGVNSLYAQALERFGSQRLQDGWRMLTSQLELKQSSMDQQQQAQQQPQEHLRPVAQQTATNISQHADMPPLPPALQLQLRRQRQQQQPQQQQQRQQHQRPHQQPCLLGDGPISRLSLRLQQPAEIACLSLQLPQALHSLHLTVPYQTFGPAAAATSAAVAVFLSSLRQHQHLQHLHLAFHSSDYGAVLCQGGTGLSRLPELWRHSMRALTAAMQVNCGLSELVLAAYPGQLPAEELAALQEVMAAARRRLRLAVLMGTHPRLGASSPILRLPHEVMRMLLNAAVPAIGCVLQLQLPLDLGAQHGLPGAFSSSDGSDTSDMEDSSSATDSDSD